ncbi:MAG: ThuA domain-containing protein, partial [Nocardioidaceae bacterium]
AAADANNTAGAVAALQQFNSAVYAQVVPSGEKAAERAALTSAARTLIDQLKGDSVDTSGTGITTSPWASVIRIFTEPTPFTPTPGATYKVLVNGHTRGFRHEHIVDTEAMVQQLGAANGFDVEIWDPNLGLGPGRQAPAGVVLTENPLLDLSKLMQYKTLVFASTVGTGATGMTAAELANLQAYIRAGGGFVAIHGATDSMQGTPWYMDLVGAGFTNHGGNAGGIMPDCGACGEVELITADPAHATTTHLPSRFTIHEELYNTNRNPVELGLVHPLVLENESSLVGQIGYNTGSLMNSDRHGMVWCRNFDGGRSFNTVIGHSWQLIHDSWYRQQ